MCMKLVDSENSDCSTGHHLNCRAFPKNELSAGGSKMLVNFNEESICVEKPDSLTFLDFDSWVRRRFCINSDNHVAYFVLRSENGRDNQTVYTEVIPSGTLTDIDELHIRIVQNKYPTKGTKMMHSCWKYLVTYTPFLLLMMFAWAISPRVRADMNNPDMLTQVLDLVGLNRKLRLFFVEGFIGFICWAVSNLFIRRYMNPETHANALERFAPDAIFGGIAAGVQSVMKIILNRNIHGV